MLDEIFGLSKWSFPKSPFFPGKDSPQGPPTANCQLPPTANCPPPPTTNCQTLNSRRSHDHGREGVPVNVRFCWRCNPFSFFSPVKDSPSVKRGVSTPNISATMRPACICDNGGRPSCGFIPWGTLLALSPGMVDTCCVETNEPRRCWMGISISVPVPGIAGVDI